MIEHDITDHYPVLAIINCDAASKGNKSHKFARCIVNFNENDFVNDLKQKIATFIPKIFEILENNLNEVFNEFYFLISSTIDAHAPLKKPSRKQNRLKNKPWITKGLLASIKRKQAMHKTHYVNGSRVAQLLYKNYCNVLTKTKTIAKNFITIKSLANIILILKKHGIFCELYCLQNLLPRCLTVSLLTMLQ